MQLLHFVLLLKQFSDCSSSDILELFPYDVSLSQSKLCSVDFSLRAHKINEERKVLIFTTFRVTVTVHCQLILISIKKLGIIFLKS